MKFYLKSLPVTVAGILLLAGCVTQNRTALSAGEVKILAQQLANDEAFTRYGCRPFEDGQSPRFEQNHWVWNDRHGYGRGDLEAFVVMSADGLSHEVNLTVSVNEIIY